jgi:hypothetical protein
MLHLGPFVPSSLLGRRGSQVEGWCGWLEYQGHEKHFFPLARKPADYYIVPADYYTVATSFTMANKIK